MRHLTASKEQLAKMATDGQACLDAMAATPKPAAPIAEQEQSGSYVALYTLAYEPDHEVELCSTCADSAGHGCGALGAVSRGAVWGECEGANHTAQGAQQ